MACSAQRHGHQPRWDQRERQDGWLILVGCAIPQPWQHQPAQTVTPLPPPTPSTLNPPSTSSPQHPQQLLQSLVTSQQHLPRDQLISQTIAQSLPWRGLDLVKMEQHGICCLQQEKRKLFTEAKKTAKSKRILHKTTAWEKCSSVSLPWFIRSGAEDHQVCLAQRGDDGASRIGRESQLWKQPEPGHGSRWPMAARGGMGI